MILFIHILCASTLFGLIISALIYTILAKQQRNSVEQQYLLKITLYQDRVFFPLLIMVFFTAGLLVKDHHFPSDTPWIIVAYIALGLQTVIWFLLVLIKRYNRKHGIFQYQKTMIFLYSLMILIFCIMIHDAVTQQTRFWLS